jgi:hypothetical protein
MEGQVRGTEEAGGKREEVGGEGGMRKREE